MPAVLMGMYILFMKERHHESVKVQEAPRGRDEPAKPRGPGLRTAQVAEQNNSCVLSWGTAHGTQDIGSLVPKCPVALACDDSCAPCRVMWAGQETRHGAIGLGYPERVSGILRFRCVVQRRNFSLVTPTVYEALPENAIVQPELVVLTEDSIFRKEAWRVLAMKVLSQHHSCCPAAACTVCSSYLGLIQFAGCSHLLCLAGLEFRRGLCQSSCSNCGTGTGYVQLMASVLQQLVVLARTG